MKRHPIRFVGAGPGAPDLITVRGLEALKQADLVVYAGSLVDERLLDAAPATAVRRNSAAMELAEIIEVMREAYEADKRVVRLHTGDPALYGAVAEQYRQLTALGIPYEVVPGVSSVFAAAAALKTEFTVPGVSQSLILTRTAGRTPVPAAESLAGFAAHGCTLALFLSVDRLPELAEQLRAAGRPETTPVAVVYRASWPNETIIRGTLRDIADKVAAAGIRRQAQIIVGEVLDAGGAPSLLYADSFPHGYRGGAGTAPARCALFALTGRGVDKAAEIAAGLAPDTIVFTPEKYADRVAEHRRRTFPEGGFGEAFAAAFREFDGLIAVMAAGIVVRHLAGLCADKRSDPAVVVGDEAGNYLVSLLSGHQGGGNALARRAAAITGGKAVITTATDGRGLYAFDLLAQEYCYRIVNPEELAFVTAALLDGEALQLAMPPALFDRHYAAVPNLSRLDPADPQTIEIVEPVSGRTLRLARRRFTLGVGCRRGVGIEHLAERVEAALFAAGVAWEAIDRIGSAELKRDEPGLLALARRHGKELVFFGKEALNRPEVPNPSAAAQRHFGIRSVSEAAALLAAGPAATLALPKQADEAVTVAVAEVMT